MTNMMLGDSTLESLTPSVNAPWIVWLEVSWSAWRYLLVYLEGTPYVHEYIG
jgi:hypothetical protein